MYTSYPLLKPNPCPTQKMEVGAVTGLYLVLLSVTLNGLPVSPSALVVCFTEDKGCSQLVHWVSSSEFFRIAGFIREVSLI